MAISMDVIKKYAPLVRLHAYDRHRPLSVEEYLETVDLVSGDWTLISTNVTPDLLSKAHPSGTHLRWKAPLPTGHDDAKSGAPLVNGRCTSPVYVKVFEETGYVDIVYAFLFAFSGFQTFRIGILDGFYNKKRNFTWARMARHECDWEHVTVRVTRDGSRILNVFLGQHGGSECLSPTKINYVPGTSHPIVWSAWNTHSNYAYSGTVKHESIPVGGFLPIRWLNVADVTTNDSIECYVKPWPFFSVVPWETWNNLIDVDRDAASAKWMVFPGPWGRPTVDNSHFDAPPDLPANAHKTLLNLANIVATTRIASIGDFLHAEAPKSPPHQKWWRSKEPKLTYLRSEEHGGGGGDSFDDSAKLTLYQSLRQISIRAKSRVDQVTMVLSDGTTLRHGGSGGVAQPALDIPPSDALIRVELCIGSYEGGDRVFWIKFITREGRTLEGGVKTDKVRVIDVPETFTALGMFGRSGTEIDRFGLLMRVPTPEQVFYASAQHGGSGGTAFDDTDRVTRFQWVQRIAIRTADRVDRVSFTLNDGAAVNEDDTPSTTVISHGGNGGTERAIDLEEDDRIVKVELSLGSKDGSDRVFWIRFTTASGLTLAGGKVSGSIRTINVPDGFCPLGFIGRAGSEVDKLGLVMRAASGQYETVT